MQPWFNTGSLSSFCQVWSRLDNLEKLKTGEGAVGRLYACLSILSRAAAEISEEQFALPNKSV